MVNSLSKGEPWLICNEAWNWAKWAQFSQTRFDLKTFEYFKIRGDLEEDVIRKNVPNWISYLHELSWSFSHFLSIFLTWKMDFGFILNRISADVWGPPVIGSIATCPVLTGCHGQRSLSPSA
jgi:hypothetical protein